MASKYLNYPADWVYQWGLHDCVSLVIDLCQHIGLMVPPGYAAWHRLPEGKAAVRALKRWGSMAAGHRAILVETGQWEPGLYGYPAVVSYRGSVRCADGTGYWPARPGCEFTGTVGEDGRVWAWTPKGLSTVVDADGIAAVTVPRQDLAGSCLGEARISGDGAFAGADREALDPVETSVLGQMAGVG